MVCQSTTAASGAGRTKSFSASSKIIKCPKPHEQSTKTTGLDTAYIFVKELHESELAGRRLFLLGELVVTHLGAHCKDIDRTKDRCRASPVSKMGIDTFVEPTDCEVICTRITIVVWATPVRSSSVNVPSMNRSKTSLTPPVMVGNFTQSLSETA